MCNNSIICGMLFELSSFDNSDQQNRNNVDIFVFICDYQWHCIYYLWNKICQKRGICNVSVCTDHQLYSYKIQ